MRKILLVSAFLLILPFSLAIAKENRLPGRRLKEIVKDKYPGGNVYIGATAHARALKDVPVVAAILDREFSYITPSNEFKQAKIHPTPEKWDWSLAEMWLAWAKQKGQVMRIHGPVSPQCSTWTKEDNRSAGELKKNMEEYMRKQCLLLTKHPHVLWMDVVNETISEDGSWFGPAPGTEKWENPWPRIGYDTDRNKTPLYIAMAFKITNKHAPGIKQVINNHALTAPSVKKLKELVIYLRQKGLRVDGISWQGHIESGWELDKENIRLLHDLISWAHKNKLEFHITEFQSYYLTKRERKTKWNKNPIPVSADEVKLRLPSQAKTYEAVLRILLEHRNTGVVTMNYWHLIDSQSQSRDGSMFNEDSSPRPAYFAVQRLLENPPASTSVKPTK